MSDHPNTLVRDLSTEAAKVFPAATVATFTLNEWVAIATILYIVLQAGYLIWKWHKEWWAKKAPNP